MPLVPPSSDPSPFAQAILRTISTCDATRRRPEPKKSCRTAYSAYSTDSLPLTGSQNLQILAVSLLSSRGPASGAQDCISARKHMPLACRVSVAQEDANVRHMHVASMTSERSDVEFGLGIRKLTLKISSSVGVTYQTSAGPPMQMAAPLLWG